jgi:pseudouridine-5'-phosphate glycosidase
MQLASRAGVSVFATGGIGGVHRGAQRTFDESADLSEFTRSPVMVVSAGVKAILDLQLTMERLETLGVPVIGYGTDELPAFYSRESGIALTQRVDTPAEAARVLAASHRLAPTFGILLANPVPTEAEIPAERIHGVISEAIDECEENGITGKATTPFLLRRIVELSGGRSLEANLALVRNNVQVATAIAVEFAAL